MPKVPLKRNAPAPDDEVGLLYSTATGIVLRTINPGPGERHHLDWLHENKPEGTTLLRLNKLEIGADDFNCPNLDFLIPYLKRSLGLNLSFGINCSVINELNQVVDYFVCCPVLYRAALASDPAKANLTLVELQGTKGDIYDPVTHSIMPSKRAKKTLSSSVVRLQEAGV